MHVDSQVLHRSWDSLSDVGTGVALKSRRALMRYTGISFNLCRVSAVFRNEGIIEQNNMSPNQKTKEDADGQYGGRTQDLGVISTTL